MVERRAASSRDGAMLTEEHVRQEPRTEEHVLQEPRTEERVRQPRQEWLVPDFWQRAIFVGVGTAIWVTGFMLMLSILLVFIGLPLFFFGLAMTEAGLKGWR
jgi:hypothetical protein